MASIFFDKEETLVSTNTAYRTNINHIGNGKALIIFAILIVGIASGCQHEKSISAEPLSIIYGHKEGKNKAIYLSDQQGKQRIKVIDTPKDGGGYPAVSPDGKHIAFYGKYDQRRTWSIHLAGIDGSGMRRLTQVKNVWDSGPAWSPDGKTIAFAREFRDQNGNWQEQIWLMNADGTDQRQIKGLEGGAPEFMADGRLLFHSKTDPSQISIANNEGSHVIQLTHDDSDNYQPKISPDGSKIAYLSNRDGNQEVYLMNIDGSDQKRLTKNAIQEWGPAWSTDGTKVLFSSQNVHGPYDLYQVNTDGTSIEKVLDNASQAATVYKVDQVYLDKLLGAK